MSKERDKVTTDHSAALADERWGDRVWVIRGQRGHMVAEVLPPGVNMDDWDDEVDPWPDTTLHYAETGEAIPGEPPCA
jgi:hypothetical protein